MYLKYKTVENYKKYFNNNKNYIYWNDFIDLLEKVFNINIIIRYNISSMYPINIESNTKKNITK